MKPMIKKIQFSVIFVFVFIELVLYSIFMYIDIFHTSEYILSNQIKFVGVVLCFFFSLLPFVIKKNKANTIRNHNKVNNICNYNKEEKQDTIIVRLALLFTVISDLFILILDYYNIGLMTFIVVQMLYLLRLVLWNQSVNKKQILYKKLLRNVSIVAVVLSILFILQVNLEILLLLSCFYFVSIFFNTIDSIQCAYKKRAKHIMLYACGMFLFLLCDINVGLFNLGDFIDISSNWFHALYSFSTIAMWMFYLPSQVLIVLSICCKDGV